MKKQLINLTSLFLLASFLVNFLQVPVEVDCVENICEVEEKMSCCKMDRMEMNGCECPEMTTQEIPEKENSMAVPVSVLSKIIASYETVFIKDITRSVSSRVLNNLNYPICSSLNNKIYKKINTFLI